jgi:hypothetical protein
MVVMMVLLSIVMRMEYQQQTAGKQSLVAAYYMTLGNALAPVAPASSTSAAAPTASTISQAVADGYLPSQFLHGTSLNADALGVVPTVVTQSSGRVVVYGSRPVPEQEINRIASFRGFGVSGEGDCSSGDVCGASGGSVSWSQSVPQAPGGYAYYGYSQ